MILLETEIIFSVLLRERGREREREGREESIELSLVFSIRGVVLKVVVDYFRES